MSARATREVPTAGLFFSEIASQLILASLWWNPFIHLTGREPCNTSRPLLWSKSLSLAETANQFRLPARNSRRHLVPSLGPFLEDGRFRSFPSLPDGSIAGWADVWEVLIGTTTTVAHIAQDWIHPSLDPFVSRSENGSARSSSNYGRLCLNMKFWPATRHSEVAISVCATLSSFRFSLRKAILCRNYHLLFVNVCLSGRFLLDDE